MLGPNLYHVTALPPLKDLDDPLPLSAEDLLDRLLDAPRPLQLVQAVLLEDDLHLRQAWKAGELGETEPEPAVLTPRQVRGEEPLPAGLTATSAGPAGAPAESLWAVYFRWAAALAARLRSPFLSEWVVWEVSLRNALVEERARLLNVDPAPHRLAVELVRPIDGLAAIVAEWGGAPDPLEGMRRLDQARWEWLDHHEAWFTFTDDELAAYAARLALVQRWERLTQAARAANTGESHAA